MLARSQLRPNCREVWRRLLCALPHSCASYLAVAGLCAAPHQRLTHPLPIRRVALASWIRNCENFVKLAGFICAYKRASHDETCTIAYHLLLSTPQIGGHGAVRFVVAVRLSVFLTTSFCAVATVHGVVCCNVDVWNRMCYVRSLSSERTLFFSFFFCALEGQTYPECGTRLAKKCALRTVIVHKVICRALIGGVGGGGVVTGRVSR